MIGSGVSTVGAYTAHREWASRPPDERYASVQALYDSARDRRVRTEERTIDTVDLRTEAVASDALEEAGMSRLTGWGPIALAAVAAFSSGCRGITLRAGERRGEVWAMEGLGAGTAVSQEGGDSR